MKKRIFSIVMSAMLVGSLSIASVSAETISGGVLGDDPLSDIEVTNPLGVKNPVYKIVVPTDYNFVVDPFEQMDTGSQIGSADYSIINKSNVNVVTDVSFKIAKNTSAATLAPTKADYVAATHTAGYLDIAASPDKIDTDSKAASLWIGAAAAYKVTTTNATAKATKLNTGSATDDASIVYLKGSDPLVFKSGITPDSGLSVTAPTSAGNVNGIAYAGTTGALAYDDIDGTKEEIYWKNTSTASASDAEKSLSDLTQKSPNLITIGTDAKTMKLALKKAQSVEVFTNATATASIQATGSAVADGVTSFRLVGKANSNYKWAAGLIDLTVSYNFNGIAASDYDDLTFVGAAADTDNVGFTKMIKDVIKFDADTGVFTLDGLPAYDEIKAYDLTTNYSYNTYKAQLGSFDSGTYPTTGKFTLAAAWKSAVKKLEFMKDGSVVYTWTK